MEMYNLKQLVKMTLKGFEKSERYVWKPAITVFGLTIREEGLFCTFFNKRVDERVVMQTHSFQGTKTLYENPCIVYEFSDGSCKVGFFDHIKQCENYFKGLSKELDLTEF